jgi:predicted permease
MDLRGILRPGMRGYLFPLVAGLALASSVFLPWVHINEVTLSGLSEMVALWILALGALAAVLAILSLITRKNSRHPLLVVGLIALAIMFLSWRLMPRMAVERALTRSQAVAIVEGSPMSDEPNATVGVGIYIGLVSSAVLVLFGLTIVVKRASSAYVVSSADDDVD